MGRVWGSLAVLLVVFSYSFVHAGCTDVQSIINRKDLPNLDISQVVSQAIETHPRMGNAQLAYENALDDIVVARSQRFPQVDLTYDIGRLKNPTYMPALGTLETKQLGVKADLMLFDFGLTKNQVLAAHGRAQAAQMAVEDQKTLIALSSIEAYVSVLRERLNLDLALLAYQDHAELKSLPGATETDVNIVVSRKQTVCDGVQSFLQEHYKAKNFYQAILNYDPETYYLVEPLKVAVEIDPDKSFALAEVNHPAFAINEFQVESFQAEEKSARASRLPKVSLRASTHDYDQTSNEFGSPTRDGNYIGVQFSVPLTDGGRRRAKQRQAVRNTQRALLDREVLSREVRRQLKDLAQSLKTAQHRIAELEVSVQSSRSTITEMKKNLIIKGTNGKTSVNQQVLINLLEERRRLYISELELNNQKMNSILDSYNLLGQQGLLFRP